MRPYLVRQGDYLARLAHQRGFDAEEVWGHPSNRALRARRPSPEILAPGDILHLPEGPPPEGQTVQLHAENRYRARVPRVTLDIRLRGPNGENPFAGERYLVEGLGAPHEGSADGEGRVTLEIPVHVHEVHLIWERLGISMPVQVGHLDPLDEASGVRQRLDHLGHEELALEPALRAFQRARGLPETGEIDEATRDALREAHGA